MPDAATSKRLAYFVGNPGYGLAFDKAVTESSLLEVRFAKGWIVLP